MTARQPQYDLTELLTRAGAELVGRNRAIMPGANHSGPQSGQWNRFGSVVMSYMRFHRQLLDIRYQLTREGSPMTRRAFAPTAEGLLPSRLPEGRQEGAHEGKAPVRR